MNISKNVTVIPFLSFNEYKKIQKLKYYNFLYLAKSEFKVIHQFLLDQENKPEKTKIIMLRENFEEAKRENDESLSEYLLRVKKNIYRAFIQKELDHILIVVNPNNFKFFSEKVLKTYFTNDDVVVNVTDTILSINEIVLEINDSDYKIWPFTIPQKR